MEGLANLAECLKVDCAVRPQKGATSLTGEWFSMAKFAKALFVAQVTGQHDGDDVTFAVYEATDAAGTSESQLGATITMAQGIKIRLVKLHSARLTLTTRSLYSPTRL